MAYVAVLDANVLHPHVAVDLLLRLAERRLFQPSESGAEPVPSRACEQLLLKGIGYICAPADIAQR